MLQQLHSLPAASGDEERLLQVNVRSHADKDDEEGAEASQGKRGKKRSKGGEASQETNSDPHAWNQRTRRMYGMLRESFEASSDAPLSYHSMITATKLTGAHKRKVVAGCFQELLFLATHGILEIQQTKAYGNIVVAKTEIFDTVAEKA